MLILLGNALSWHCQLASPPSPCSQPPTQSHRHAHEAAAQHHHKRARVPPVKRWRLRASILPRSILRDVRELERYGHTTAEKPAHLKSREPNTAPPPLLYALPLLCAPRTRNGRPAKTSPSNTPMAYTDEARVVYWPNAKPRCAAFASRGM